METLVPVAVALAALAAVMLPLLRERTAPHAAEPALLDAEVDRYRAALREGTLCSRCAEASPPGSRFCARCGTRLGD